MLRHYLFKAFADFDFRNDETLGDEEKTLVFRRMLSLLFRGAGTWEMKMDIAHRLPRYFPGIRNLVKLGWMKMEQGINSIPPFKKTAYVIYFVGPMVDECLFIFL